MSTRFPVPVSPVQTSVMLETPRPTVLALLYKLVYDNSCVAPDAPSHRPTTGFTHPVTGFCGTSKAMYPDTTPPADEFEYRQMNARVQAPSVDCMTCSLY